MTIGQLASCTGLTVRTPRFYAEAGVIPELERTDAEYRVFGPDAVPRARLVRTLRRRAGGRSRPGRHLARLTDGASQ
jgi:DNA-binding transcriptional MerR regulator